MVANWFFESNPTAFLTLLARIADYPIDTWDHDAIVNAMSDTDAEAGRWHEYEFVGVNSVKFSLAYDPGTTVIHCRLDLPTSLIDRTELLFTVVQEFDVSNRNSSPQ